MTQENDSRFIIFITKVGPTKLLIRIKFRGSTLTKADRLLLELAVRLRANREEVLLPNSYGQVWNKLVTLT